jgi:hypothetical protein
MTYGRLEFAFLGNVYLIIGTFFEERNMREEMGEVYTLYRENVPMWIPRLRPMLKFSSKGSFTGQKLVILLFLMLFQFSSVLAQSEFPEVPDTVKAGAVIKQFTSFRAGNKLVDAECGYVIVPENRNNPNTNLIKVAFVVKSEANFCKTVNKKSVRRLDGKTHVVCTHLGTLFQRMLAYEGSIGWYECLPETEVPTR